jgi:hypothetical protein
MSISILNRGASGGLKPELTVLAPSGSTIDLLQNGIIVATYTLGADETEHTFVVKEGAYTARVGDRESEVVVDSVAQYTANLNSYATEGLILNLNGYYNTRNGHAESPSVWEDLSGNGWDATLVNSPVWLENGLRFNGSSSYANLTNTGAKTAAVRTVEIVCKVNSWTGTQSESILFRGNGVVAANNHIQYSARTSVLSNARYESWFIVGYNSDSIWLSPSQDMYSVHSIAVTMGNGCHLYLNGVKSQTLDDSNVPATNSTEFYVGKGYSSRYCNCEVYAVRLYDRKLTAEEVAHNYEVDRAILM